MKIGIFGVGVLGFVVGGFLVLVGNDVEFWDINEVYMKVVNDNGLKFDVVDGDYVVLFFVC